MDDARNNQYADEFATLARKDFMNKNILDLATNLAFKHKEYIKFLGALDCIVVFGYLGFLIQ